MCTIHLGGEQAEFLKLVIHGRSHPGASDYLDGNWLACTVEVAAGAFRGTVETTLRTDELAALLQSIEKLFDWLDNEAVFESLENWLYLRFVADGRGHIQVTGRLEDNPCIGNRLSFQLSLDQTYLPPLIAQLRATLQEHPVIEQPNHQAPE